RIQQQTAPGTTLHRHADFLHQPQHGGHVEELRSVAELERLGAEQRSRNLGQCGILGAVNLHRSLELIASADYEPVHPKPFMGIPSKWSLGADNPAGQRDAGWRLRLRLG